jgi:predicted O-linked N-acetylglucosamine transferase (SPINDLY family)
MVHYSKGELAAAIPLFQQVLQGAPNAAAALHFLGMAHHQLKDGQPVLPLLRRAAELDPRQAAFALNLGLVLCELGQPAEALTVLERARPHAPAMPELFNILGQVHQQLGNLPAAIEHYEKAVRLQPAFPFALNNLGGAWSLTGRHAEAIRTLEKARQLEPRSPEILINLGRACRLAGRNPEAVESFRAALALDPGNAEATLGWAQLLEESSQAAEALALCQQALLRQPARVPLLMQAGSLQRSLGQFEAAQASWAKALAAAPAHFPAWWQAGLSLPIIYLSEAEMADRRAAWLKGIQQTEAALAGRRFNPAGLALPQTNFNLHYQCCNDREAQVIYGRVVTRIAEVCAAGLALPGRPPRTVPRKIRVGFVSAFFNLHTVFKLFHGWITRLDPSLFETHVFHFNPHRDKATDFLQQHATTLTAGALPLNAAARAVAAAGLDILIYPDIGMDAMTQMLAALRLAPVQCQAWGHPVTSGLPAMDYFLSSDLMEPADAQAHYCEKLVRLPGLSIRYPEPDASRAVRPPGLPDDDGPCLFVCLQSLFKLLPLQDRLMARIAAQVEGGRFVFISHPSPPLTAQYQHRLEQAFREAGVNPQGRLIFLPQLNYGEFLGLARAAGVILDSVGWSGGNTTLEALSFARPLVTLPGEFMRGRHTAAILRQIGVTATVAATPDDYVALAVRLATDPAWRNEIAEQIRLQRQRAYNDPLPIRALEQFLINCSEKTP